VAAYDIEVMVALRAMADGAGTVEQFDLSEDYLRAGGRIANRRVAQAGHRLGPYSGSGLAVSTQRFQASASLVNGQWRDIS
jgi:hypothetical protein